ncbi:MAG: cyclic nucleotide-binding domain-containing protein [Lentisphaeria bacterium]|nr:ATP-binding protein [Lentisphaeria bacterium]NQZ70157.1 cyclic nucleotide-binding domain-containing protein [Lentisphaeria bacterium]
MKIEDHIFFDFFSEENKTYLLDNISIVEFESDGLLFDQGENITNIYLVLDGAVNISGKTNSGKYEVIATLNENEFFGEFAAIDGGERTAKAEISGHTQLAEIPNDIFMGALDKCSPEEFIKLLRHMIGRIRSFHQKFFDEIVHRKRNAIIGELTNSIVHDFQSPLSIISGTAKMIRDKHDDLDTEQQCQLIDVQVKRIQSMAGDVLDFAKGNSYLQKKTVNLGNLLEYFELLNKEYLKRLSVDLLITTKDIEIYADPDKLVRVLQNLTNNAAQSMASGEIRIDIDKNEKHVMIIITDNGPGIPDDIKDVLFDPYITEGKPGGTGLGTAIAKSLIEAHGGDISFSSSSEGTTFIILLPTNY